VSRRVVLLAAVIGLAGCGGGGGSQAPSSPGERAAVAQLKYCLEGAGAITAAPGNSIPELGKAPSGQDADGAKRVLVAAWRDTKHSADVYYADSDAAAAKAAGGLGTGAESKGRLVVAPGRESPASSDELLLLSDCLL
jgi:hypothetical protein